MAREHNLVEGLDPTDQEQVSAAMLLQMIREAYPNDMVGFILVQEEDPDMVNNPWYARYLRIKPSDPLRLLRWNGAEWVLMHSLPANGTIINAMLADLSVTNSKIVSVDWSKITNRPLVFTPAGPAGGDLTGSYPNPVIKTAGVVTDRIADAAVTAVKIVDGAINGPKISNNSITNEKIAAGITLEKLTNTISGAAMQGLQTLRRNSANTAWEGVYGLSVKFQVVGQQALPVGEGKVTFAKPTYPDTSHPYFLLNGFVDVTLITTTGDAGWDTNNALPVSAFFTAANGPIVVYGNSLSTLDVYFPAGAIQVRHKVTGVATAIDRTKWQCQLYLPS